MFVTVTAPVALTFELKPVLVVIEVTPAFVNVTEEPKETAPPPLIPVPAVTVIDELVNEPFPILLKVFDAPLIVLFVNV